MSWKRVELSGKNDVRTLISIRSLVVYLHVVTIRIDAAGVDELETLLHRLRCDQLADRHDALRLRVPRSTGFQLDRRTNSHTNCDQSRTLPRIPPIESRITHLNDADTLENRMMQFPVHIRVGLVLHRGQRLVAVASLQLLPHPARTNNPAVHYTRQRCIERRFDPYFEGGALPPAAPLPPP